ncbi:MAG: hypothetical protein ACOCQX_04555, partial [Candidatus Nanoarchaeia archaeon]
LKTKNLNTHPMLEFLMNEEVRKDILEVLEKAIEAFPNYDESRLRALSNQTIHNSSIYQDKDSINIAVLVYALSKVITRRHDNDDILEKLNQAKTALEKNNIDGYEKALSKAIDVITTYDKKINFYVKHIINQAGIKKGTRIYEHGISLARTAEILNISQWELMKYLGQTNLADQQGEFGLSVEQRIEYARKLFGVENE